MPSLCQNPPLQCEATRGCKRVSDIDLEIAALKLWISLYEQWEVDAFELAPLKGIGIESSGLPGVGSKS